jgi:threonine dehydratase
MRGYPSPANRMNLDDIKHAATRLAGSIVKTPCTRSDTLSAMTGAEVYLKFENLQYTSSFKERGALNCLLQLSAGEQAKGVIAMSAGNHAQALAFHGARLNIPVTIVMPRSTPNTKVEQTRVFGADVILHGNVFDETRRFTESLAQERDLVLVHPFDDERIMAGQGTVGLEIMQAVPDADVVIVPVGGGGLISGTAMAIKGLSTSTQVIGVQAERFAGATCTFHTDTAKSAAGGTVAEGIAVKSPGAHTMPVIMDQVDDMLLVTEAQLEQAIFELLEIEKTVAEGAGAAPLAALRANRSRFENRKVVLLLSGGNIDMMILSSVLQRGLVRSSRLIRMTVEIPDVPGALASLTRVLGELESNIVEISHQRAFGGSTVRATLVELVQMRGEEQHDRVCSALAEQGYEACVIE